MASFVLTEADRDLLRDMIAEFKRRRAVAPRQYRPDDVPGAPDVYVARVPEGGIPALSLRAGASVEDVPGAADCAIYRVLVINGARRLSAVGITLSVLNVSLCAVAGNSWVPIARDKFGAWLAVPTPCAAIDYSSGTGTGTGTIIGTGTGGGGVSAPCQSADFNAATAVFSNKTLDCTCLPTTPTLGSPGVDALTISTTGCPGNVALTLSCVGGQYSLAGAGLTVSLVSFSASPFVIVWDISGYGANCGASGGSARLTVMI